MREPWRDSLMHSWRSSNSRGTKDRPRCSNRRTTSTSSSRIGSLSSTRRLMARLPISIKVSQHQLSPLIHMYRHQMRGHQISRDAWKSWGPNQRHRLCPGSCHWASKAWAWRSLRQPESEQRRCCFCSTAANLSCSKLHFADSVKYKKSVSANQFTMNIIMKEFKQTNFPKSKTNAWIIPSMKVW